ncbi:hypothetical protein [Polaribacter porphyrae]|uniref:Uncharacterized protein n=1 Tax=Polaribacter porphyrae TaxID=1137780 RepID=A0A2S7WLW3_9FLAO|nr:hypothetical protein [Polaribacter porphyrae]PQJ78563.1 hypothetical protein BTO18_04890 [Polaribacter porphyrae]
MKNEYNDSKFKKLLDKLQQESWQLELLISGFAIFGLISSLNYLEKFLNEAIALESYSKYLLPIAYIACWVLIINLVIHVVLRGLWIGAIGLRYVSGDIDYDSLNYKKRFTEYLKKKVGSFDKFIGVLENYCSILFALTFLYLFYIISFFTIILVIVFAGNIFIKSGLLPDFLGYFLLGIFGCFFIFLAFIVFIDFITQGFLKKKEWTSFLYFPIYKVFSVITLSFLYRPLVYNVLDDKFSRRLTFILTPIYILIFFLTTFQNIRSNYVLKSNNSSVHFSNKNNYLNTLGKNKYVSAAAIQSKIIKDNYIYVFIPFKEKIENLIFDQYKNLQPLDDKRGFRTDFFSSKKNIKNKDSLTSLYLKAFQKIYTFKLDSLLLKPEFSTTEINNQLGFETIIPLDSINYGKHIINIKRFITLKNQKKLKKEHIIDIPFWYIKQ